MLNAASALVKAGRKAKTGGGEVLTREQKRCILFGITGASGVSRRTEKYPWNLLGHAIEGK